MISGKKENVLVALKAKLRPSDYAQFFAKVIFITKSPNTLKKLTLPDSYYYCYLPDMPRFSQISASNWFNLGMNL